jgi:protein SCO1/2
MWTRALALFIAAVALIACGGGSPPPHGVDISGVAWGRDFHLTDHLGRPRSLVDFKGKTVMLFFGYTHCPDLCPTTLAQMAQVRAKLGRDAPRMQGLFVTVDPKRDTPAVLAKYMTAFDASFLGLYGDEATTAAVARDFKTFAGVQKPDARGHYTVDHGGGIYVFDSRGRLRLMMRPGTTVDDMAADVATLLKE